MFTLFWRDGRREVIEGNKIADAMTSAGYGAGSLRALDFYAKGNNKEYTWNNEKYGWVRVD